jgi:DNA topoisomerase-2
MTNKLNYIKLSQLQQIIKRPAVYIGDTNNNDILYPIYNQETKKLNFEMTCFSPALLKLFDEAVSNAVDHSFRKLPIKVTKINIDLNENGIITISNNGTGIPIEKKENIYIPEMIFGHLNSGSNYDDDKQHFLIGTNGLGIKLTAIFSDFLELVCITNGKIYTQKFTDSLSKISKPKIKTSSKKDFTSISFKLKCHIFPMDLFISRCVLLLPILPKGVVLTVTKNDTIILKQKSTPLDLFFKEYISDFSGSDLIIKQDPWHILFFPKKGLSLSFVNGNITYNHGKHVDFIFNTFTNILKQKYNWITVTLLSRHLNIIVTVTLDKPQFSSQTKDTLTTPLQDLPKIIFQSSFIKKFIESVIFLEIKQEHDFKEEKKLSKQDGKKKKTVSIPNLHDANFAGTKSSEKCTLYLTEGLSALSFVISGLVVIGKDYNGAFPLKVNFKLI